MSFIQSLVICWLATSSVFAAEEVRATLYLTDLQHVFFTTKSSEFIQVRGKLGVGTIGKQPLPPGTKLSLHISSVCGDMARAAFTSGQLLKIEGWLENALSYEKDGAF